MEYEVHCFSPRCSGTIVMALKETLMIAEKVIQRHAGKIGKSSEEKGWCHRSDV